MQANVRHDWKKNTLSMESKGWKFIIDLHTQMVGKEALSSDSEEEDEGKQRMEPDKEGVFLSCNMLRVDKGEKEEENEYLKECREGEEGKVVTIEVEGNNIQSKPRKKKDPTVRYMVSGPHRKKRIHRT